MTSKYRSGSAWVVALLLMGGCANASDSSQVASGPISTTPPLALPLELLQPEINTSAAAPLATTEPVAEPAAPTALAVPDPESDAGVVEAPTSAPATSKPEGTDSEPAAAVEPTQPAAVADTGPTATSEPTTAETGATVTAAPTTAGATISLGDFEVVNLLTGATQNIAELSPSGPAMLWFWAPH